MIGSAWSGFVVPSFAEPAKLGRPLYVVRAGKGRHRGLAPVGTKH